MGMGPDSLFCGGSPIFHSEQYLGRHVQEHGDAERHAGSLYQSALSALGSQAFVESLCRYIAYEEMVDQRDADPDVPCHAFPAFPLA